jgi:hypothetical protein
MLSGASLIVKNKGTGTRILKIILENLTKNIRDPEKFIPDPQHRIKSTR